MRSSKPRSNETAVWQLQFRARIRNGFQQDKKQRLAGIARLNLKLDQMPNEIPRSLVAKLTQPEYLELLGAERGHFERLEPRLQTPLNGLSQLITVILKQGAKAIDFSRVYCQTCDFSGRRNLSGANFDKANLAHANFSHVDLKNASFRDANLSDTVFFHADLAGANLRDNTQEVDWDDETFGLPLFECANLKGADLTGTPLLYYSQWPDDKSREVIAPRMFSSQVDKTTALEYFTIVAVTTVSDDYLTKHSTGPEYFCRFSTGTLMQTIRFLTSHWFPAAIAVSTLGRGRARGAFTSQRRWHETHIPSA